MSLKKKVVSGVKWTTLSNLIIAFIQILRLAILTRLLEKSDFGLIAIAMMVIGFTEIFSGLGLVTAIIHKQNISNKQYSSIFWMNVFASIVMFGILCVISPLLSEFYGNNEISLIVPILGIQILINSFGKLFQTIKIKNLEFNFISKVNVIATFLGFVVTIIFALLKFGVYSLVFGTLIQTIFTQSIYSFSGIGTKIIYFYFNYKEIKEFVKIGSYQLGAQILDFISTKIDVLIIGHFFGMQDLGVYNIAKDLILKPYQIITSLVSNVASSAFSKIQHDVILVKNNYARVVEILTAISLPVYVIIFVFAVPIVGILYDQKFAGVAIFLRILTLVGICNSINSSVGILQVALGRTDIGFKWTLIRLVVSMISILFASLYSLYVVAYSQMIISLIFLLLYWRLVIFKLIQMEFKEYVETFKKPAIYSISAGLVVLFVFELLKQNIFIGIILIFVYCLIYLILNLKFNKLFIVNVWVLIVKK